jgi:DNA-directed RNA polymerase specialized sigma24 family protein
MLNVHLGTVKSRLMRGRAALREALREDADVAKALGSRKAEPARLVTR